MMLRPSEAELRDLVARQVSSFYPVLDDEVDEIGKAIPGALEACEASFSRIRNKYYRDDSGETRLNPLHGCQWTAFLYRLSRELYARAGGVSATRYTLCSGRFPVPTSTTRSSCRTSCSSTIPLGR